MMNSPDAFMFAEVGGIFLIPMGLLALGFWVWMIVECARNERGNTLIAWLLLILFVGVIGAPLYFFLRKSSRRQTAQFESSSPLYQPWRKDRRIRQH
jgi:membrane protein DedA with SNARE-associated domain